MSLAQPVMFITLREHALQGVKWSVMVSVFLLLQVVPVFVITCMGAAFAAVAIFRAGNKYTDVS